MKKNIPIFYPEFDSDTIVSGIAAKAREPIRTNSKLRIGKPYNRCYQYIHTSLNFNKHSLHSFKDFLTVEGMEVMVGSILKMRNGEYYPVLVSPERISFGGNVQHLYAETKKAFAAEEIICTSYCISNWLKDSTA